MPPPEIVIFKPLNPPCLSLSTLPRVQQGSCSFPGPVSSQSEAVRVRQVSGFTVVGATTHCLGVHGVRISTVRQVRELTVLACGG